MLRDTLANNSERILPKKLIPGSEVTRDRPNLETSLAAEVPDMTLKHQLLKRTRYQFYLLMSSSWGMLFSL